MTKDDQVALRKSYAVWRKAANEVLEISVLPTLDELRTPHTDAMIANRAAYAAGRIDGIHEVLSKAKVRAKKIQQRTRQLRPDE